jgi:hypothetical protein
LPPPSGKPSRQQHEAAGYRTGKREGQATFEQKTQGKATKGNGGSRLKSPASSWHSTYFSAASRLKNQNQPKKETLWILPLQKTKRGKFLRIYRAYVCPN